MASNARLTIIIVPVRQIHINLLKGHNNLNLLSSDILEFSTAQHIRMRFQKIIFPNDKTAMLDSSFKRKLFYTIKDIFIGGRCMCNGHAKKCKQVSEDSVSRQLKFNVFRIIIILSTRSGQISRSRLANVSTTPAARTVTHVARRPTSARGRRVRNCAKSANATATRPNANTIGS